MTIRLFSSFLVVLAVVAADSSRLVWGDRQAGGRREKSALLVPGVPAPGDSFDTSLAG